MRIFYSVIFIVLLFAAPLFAQGQNVQKAQERPLTQTEYVQLLYDLQRNPNKKDEVVETVRKRGIAFVLTDGLRELTLSKSRSDETLKRTLEEANRRRENPAATHLPSEKESAEIMAKAREAMKTAIGEMPDFIVKENINRSISYAGTNNFVSLDKMVVGVRYSSEKGEQYQVLRLNGTPVEAKEGSNYGGLEGSTTTGEFVRDLAEIFNEENKTTYKILDTDVLLGRPGIVFEFEMTLANSKDRDPGIGFGTKTGYLIAPMGKKGKIWIDRQNYRVLRYEYDGTELRRDFPIKAFVSRVDYDWVEINKTKYLLPSFSDVRFTFNENGRLLQTRNEIRFRSYNKFDVDIKVLDDDEPVEEETPAKKP